MSTCRKQISLPESSCPAFPKPYNGAGGKLAIIGLLALALTVGTATAESRTHKPEELVSICIIEMCTFEGTTYYMDEHSKCGYATAQGEIAIPLRFGSAWNFSANGLAVAMEDGKWGYINAQGEWLIPPKFGHYETYSAKFFSVNDLATVRADEKLSYINTSGQIVIQEDIIFNRKVLKNGKGEIIWPAMSVAQICAEAQAAAQQE